MAGKVEDKKLEKYENESYYLLWWSDKRYFPYNCLVLSDEDNLVSRTDNFVNVNVFNSIITPIIKIVTVYKWSIFQVEWLIAPLISFVFTPVPIDSLIKWQHFMTYDATLVYGIAILPEVGLTLSAQGQFLFFSSVQKSPNKSKVSQKNSFGNYF